MPSEVEQLEASARDAWELVKSLWRGTRESADELEEIIRQYECVLNGWHHGVRPDVFDIRPAPERHYAIPLGIEIESVMNFLDTDLLNMYSLVGNQLRQGYEAVSGEWASS